MTDRDSAPNAADEPDTDEPTPGIVMPIGGAEDKLGRMSVLREVVKYAGGPDARIVVLSTASSLGDEITHAYLRLFSELGAAQVSGIRPESRAEAADPEIIAAVENATGVFMTGGNQTKLATLVVGTPLGRAIQATHARGAVVAGTSAGASVCSLHMVSFGSGGATPKFRVGQVSEGLGLIRTAIVDQHFTQRNRFGRLLALVAANPAQLGVGIDEDTAAVIRPDSTLTVLGRGVVTIFDADDVVTTAYTATGTQPLMLSGVKLHSLPRGAVFDLNARCLVSAPGLEDTGEPAGVATVADVPGDSRPRTRRIAAEGRHETVAELRRRAARRASS